jgi:hypothetical protein
MGRVFSENGERRGVYRVLLGNLTKRVHSGDPGLVGRTVIRWIFRKWDVGILTGSSWIRIERGNAHL